MKITKWDDISYAKRIQGVFYDFGTALSAVGIAGIVENQDLTRLNERNLQKGSTTTKLRLLFLLFKVECISNALIC